MKNQRKQRSDANWNNFTAQQKQAIEEWLFVRNLSYEAVLRRCKKELGLKWSLTAIWRVYKHLAAIRAVQTAKAIQQASGELLASGCPADELRPSLMKMAATRLLEKAIEDNCTEDVAVYARLVLQGEALEILRERTALAAKRHEFNASQAALKALPLVDEFTLADHERETQRIAAVRRMLFGNAPKKGPAT
jgi:hypothetical protein